MNVSLLTFVFLYSWSVLASDDVFDIAEKYNKSKIEMNKIEIEKRKVLSDIYTIEKETRKVVLEKTELDEKKVQLDHELMKVSKKIVQTESELRLLTPELVGRTAALEKIKDLPWFYVFLTSQSIKELDQTYRTASALNQQQIKLLDRYIEMHKKLNVDKKILFETAQNIVGMKKKILGKEKVIEANQSNKMKVLKSLDFNLSNKKRSITFLKILGRNAVERSEFKNLGLLFGSNFFEKKGRIPHPVDGEIIQKFGLVDNLSQDQFELMHKGYFYSAQTGTSIRSIADGRVRFVGTIKGYGRAIIIDHGGRYYSVYSNLDSVTVSLDKPIQASQIIGEVGHRHLLFNTGLYFEIRHFSQPQNPEHWLEPRSGTLATL